MLKGWMENLISDPLGTSMVVHRNLEVLAESNIKRSLLSDARVTKAARKGLKLCEIS